MEFLPLPPVGSLSGTPVLIVVPIPELAGGDGSPILPLDKRNIIGPASGSHEGLYQLNATLQLQAFPHDRDY